MSQIGITFCLLSKGFIISCDGHNNNLDYEFDISSPTLMCLVDPITS